VPEPAAVPEPEESFASLNDPSTAGPGGPGAPAPAPAAGQEPIVWVNTGKGSGRGRYHPENTKWFGVTKEGVAMPREWAEDLAFVRAGTPRGTPARAIRSRIVSGRQAESLGAVEVQGTRNISATARAERAVTTTSIRADLSEAQGYNALLDRGEYGLQRPFGANERGVDAITAKVVRNQTTRRLEAKIYLNDMTSPAAAKDAFVPHDWFRELDEAVAEGRLNLGNPEAERAIREAVDNNQVYKRVVRVNPAPRKTSGVRIKAAETWQVV